MNYTKKELTDIPVSGKTQYKQVGPNCYFQLTSNGQRNFVRRWTQHGKRKQSKIGSFETMTIKQAVILCMTESETSAKLPTMSTLCDQFRKIYIVQTGEKNRKRFDRVIKTITQETGDTPADQLTFNDWLMVLDVYENRGATWTRDYARRTAARILEWAQEQYPQIINHPKKMVLRYRKPLKNHFDAVIKPRQLGQLLEAIEDHKNIIVRYALKFQSWSMLRPGVTAALKWDYYDKKEKILEIPAELTKQNKHLKADEVRHIQKQPHIVPLAIQSVQWLQELEAFTGNNQYIFSNASGLGKDRPLSENTLNNAIKAKQLGFDHVAHGFRATARTMLAEVLGYNAYLLELQLSHIVKDNNGNAYNRGAFIHQRAQMLQEWADFLDWLITCSKNNSAIPLDLKLCRNLFKQSVAQAKIADDKNNNVIAFPA